MISIVIPVYNEEKNLHSFNERIVKTCNETMGDYEIIYVDDGSTDESLHLIKKFCMSNNKIFYISFFRNFGQHAAVISGFKFSKGSNIITLDSDLQNPPEEIIKFLNYKNSDFDIIAGKRINRKDKFLRKFFSYFMNKIISTLTGTKLSDYGCMMRMYSRKIVDVILENDEKSIYIPAFSSWLSKKTIEIEIKHNVRYSGKTKYSSIKLFQQAFDLITSYTFVPLQLIFILGCFMFILGFFLFLYLMAYRFIFGTLNSLTSFIAFQMLFSGIILFCLGIISEYICRIHKQTRKIPLFIVREKNIE